MDDVAAEVRQWLVENWDPDLSLLEWRGAPARPGGGGGAGAAGGGGGGGAGGGGGGAGGPGGPPRRKGGSGRGRPAAAAETVHAEFDRIGAVGTPAGGGIGLAAPTILEHGSDDLKSRLLRPIVTGEHTWCQLFSEPGSGSDLAGLTTRADLDGDEWIINGQKVWNTSAHHAKYGML